MLRALAMVAVSGCMVGFGPTIAVRKDRVLVGVDGDYRLEVHSSSSGTPERHPILIGIGAGVTTAIGQPGSTEGQLYGSSLVGLSSVKDVTAAGTASLSIGTFGQRPIDGPLFAAIGGGVMQGVECEDYALTAELGIRWRGHLELYLSAKANSVYEVGDGGTCPKFKLLGGGVR